jgi:hypothetical protein
MANQFSPPKPRVGSGSPSKSDGNASKPGFRDPANKKSKATKKKKRKKAGR